MKKFLAISAGAALAVSMLAFTGCNDKENEYAIKGDYKEATAQDMADFSNLNLNFGDATAENFMLGLQVKANFDGSVNMGDAMSASGKASLNYVYNQTADSIKGLGSAATEYSAKYAGQELKGNYSVNVFNNDTYAYADVKSGETDLFAGKVDYMAIINGVMSLPSRVASVAEGETDGPVDLLALAAQYKVGVYVDKKDGWKVKLSASADTVNAIIDSYITDETQATAVKENLSFNKFVFEVYFSVDSNGTFKQLSLNSNLDMKIKLPQQPTAEASAPAQELALKFNGGIVLKTTASVVELGQIDETKYTDYTEQLKNLINGGNGGNGGNGDVNNSETNPVV